MEDASDATGLYWTLWWIVGLKWIGSAVRTLWVLVNNLYVIPAHCVWMALLWPVSLLNPELYSKIEEFFFGKILGLVAFWNHTAGYRVMESGDSLDDIFHSQRFLYMPNHQSTADVPLCMTIFSAKNRGPQKIMWIMDKVFKFTNFGLVSWLHDDFFILAGKDNRDRSLIELKAHLKEVYVPKQRRGLVVFPEGGFLRKRKPVSHRFALKNNLPLLEHCTLPRTGALEVIMDCLGPKSALSDHNSNNGSAVDKVSDLEPPLQQNGRTSQCSISDSGHDQVNKIVDVTIAYEQGKPLNLLNIITAVRPSCITHVHYRVFDVKQVPSDPEELKQWMYQLYFDKEEMLQKFYETGEFPYKMFDPQASPPRELIQKPLEAVITNIFYLLSTAMFATLGIQTYWALATA